jgi:hypothetical protein
VLYLACVASEEILHFAALVQNDIFSNHRRDLRMLGPSNQSLQRLDRLWLARLISLILHPFLVASLTIVLVLYLDSGTIITALTWAVVCIALVIAPALIFLRHKLTRQHYSDADVSVREQRHGFYLFSLGCMIVCFGVLLWLGAPRPLLSLFAAALAALVAFAVVTQLWLKVSIHTGAMAGATAAVAFYSLPLAALFTLGLIVIGWARLVLKRHTLPEILAGCAIAAAIVGAGMSFK